MILINPLQAILWTFRRSERDVVNLYNSLSPVMQLATGGNMLNFGYWNSSTRNPLEAQSELCSLVGKMAELDSVNNVIDVGSGLSAPAFHWKSMHNFLQITCVNINYQQLTAASKIVYATIADRKTESLSFRQTNGISLVNATSKTLPFADQSVDRVIALESAQHFKPLIQFIKESWRILEHNGMLAIAMPVTTVRAKPLAAFMKLGILSLTWSSEHYLLDDVISTAIKSGFKIMDTRLIGGNVYEPLTEYYIQNRRVLKERILREYPSYLETILYMSLMKMKDVSQEGLIDYAVIKAVKM